MGHRGHVEEGATFYLSKAFKNVSLLVTIADSGLVYKNNFLRHIVYKKYPTRDWFEKGFHPHVPAQLCP